VTYRYKRKEKHGGVMANRKTTTGVNPDESQGQGHIPSNILVGGHQWEYPHKYYYVLMATEDQY